MAVIGRRSPPAKVNASDISDNSITSAHIQSDALTHADLAPNSITASELADNAVDTAAIAADAVDGTKIANDSIDSEHIAADSIDAEHYAPGSVDGTAIANDAIDSQHYAADSIDTEHYAAGSVDGTAIANDAVDSQHIAADSIDAEHYAAGSVDGTAIANDAIDSQHIAADSIDTEHYAAGSVDNTAIATNAVTDTELNSAKLNGIESGATADQTAAELLTAIKTVDGSSSGLDAQYLSGTELGNVYLNTKNISGFYTWTGQFQTGASGQTYNICTHSEGYWGTGYVDFEVFDYYYDGRDMKNCRWMLRSHAHTQYSPSHNTGQVFGGASQTPYASGPTYPSGLIGYWHWKIDLPSYQGIAWRLRAAHVTIVSSQGECYGSNKFYPMAGGRI